MNNEDYGFVIEDLASSYYQDLADLCNMYESATNEEIQQLLYPLVEMQASIYYLQLQKTYSDVYKEQNKPLNNIDKP